MRAVADKVSPSLVDVNTTMTANPFSSESATVGKAAGTGMVISPNGEVLTNNHVIRGASQISVTVVGGNSYTAHVIGADPTDDVALLQLSGASDLPTVTFAEPSSVTNGMKVIAMGNALGRGGPPSVTSGSITSLGRTINVNGEGPGGSERLVNVIQMNAPIQPGDSGGALVNTDGQVVGMITAGSRGFAQSGSTVGFAIPASHALDIVNQIRSGQQGGSVVIDPGYLGVEVNPIGPGGSALLPPGVNSGVLVVGVNSGTPASQAGISQNDVITRIDGQAVGNQDDLGSAIHSHHPGDKISVTWVDRTGSSHTAMVTLVPGPAL